MLHTRLLDKRVRQDPGPHRGLDANVAAGQLRRHRPRTWSTSSSRAESINDWHTRHAPYLTQDMKAAHVRHGDIEQHDGRVMLEEQLEPHSSLGFDHQPKVPAYLRGGVPTVWIGNVPD